MKYIYLLLIFTLPVCLHAQTYRGKVIIAGENGRAEAAAGAAVYWIRLFRETRWKAWFIPMRKAVSASLYKKVLPE